MDELDMNIIYMNTVTHVLYNERYTAYDIEKKTGLSRSMITKYRNNDAHIKNMSLKTAGLLQDYYMENHSISGLQAP